MSLPDRQSVILWCNGQWLEGERASMAWSDRGLTHGLGVFETMLAVDGGVVFAERHEARMSGALAVLGWDVDVSVAFACMSGLLEKNGLSAGRARVRLAVSGGKGVLRNPAEGVERMVWMSAARTEDSPASVVVGVSRWKRNDCSPLVGIKSASYAENLLVLQEAAAEGWDEALLFNHGGHLCEAATANVFLVKDGNLSTPELASGCLPGVTRDVVVELAGKMGIAFAAAELSESDLACADEVFLTSATRGVVPVRRVGQRDVSIGPVSLRLKEAWEREISRGQ